MSVKRNIVLLSTRTLAWLQRRQVVSDLPADTVKVNLGCGMAVAPGWINVDGSLNAWVANRPRWVHRIAYSVSGAKNFYSLETYCNTLGSHRFVHHDTNYGLPFEDETVDFIYSSHFLEHLERNAAAVILSESRRVLRPGGVIRVGVPDLEEAWRMYERGQKDAMLRDYFFVDAETDFSQHRYAYDYELLAAALTRAGFDDVVRRNYQEGWTPDLAVLDNRADYTLFVEARKPV